MHKENDISQCLFQKHKNGVERISVHVDHITFQKYGPSAPEIELHKLSNEVDQHLVKAAFCFVAKLSRTELEYQGCNKIRDVDIHSFSSKYTLDSPHIKGNSYLKGNQASGRGNQEAPGPNRLEEKSPQGRQLDIWCGQNSEHYSDLGK